MLHGETNFYGLICTFLGGMKYLLVGFSGAEEKQDVKIAQVGTNVFIANY